MSMMLDALRRIEAKQTPAHARKASRTGSRPVATAGRIGLQPVVAASRIGLQPVLTGVELVEPVASPPSATEPAEPLELPLALPADVPPSAPPADLAPLESVSLEEAMDQLQAVVSQAGLLYDTELEFSPEKRRLNRRLSQRLRPIRMK